MFRLVRRTLWQAYYHFNKDNGWMIAGHIAYMGLFALFPFLIFLVALAGLPGPGCRGRQFGPARARAAARRCQPGAQPAIDEVRRAPHAGLMTFGILVTLWASSSGLEALRHALNLAYDVADPPAFWKTRLESLLLTVTAAIVVIVVMILLVVIPSGAGGHPGSCAPQCANPRWQLVRRLARKAGFLLLLALLMLLYRVLPNVRLRATEVVPGAVVAWLLWLASVWGYRSTCAPCPVSALPTAAWAGSSLRCSSSTSPPSCSFSAPS